MTIKITKTLLLLVLLITSYQSNNFILVDAVNNKYQNNNFVNHHKIKTIDRTRFELEIIKARHQHDKSQNSINYN